ncbi:MAG: prolipoprotein diacylglyceryl transferase [Bacillota bacterium]
MLFEVGNLTIHTYGVMIALGVIVCSFALYRQAPRENINPDYLLEAVIISVFAGMIGARLLYVALNWDYFSANPGEIIFTQFAGLSFFGGLFLAVLVLYFWSKWRKMGFLKMADLLAPYLGLGYAFGRIGCFLNGCCYGLESDLPWALPVSMHDDLLRHPVQLYAALGALLIFVILKLLRPKRPFIGFMLLALFAFYGVLRFVVEFFRYEPEYWLGLSQAQVFSLVLTLFSVLLILVFSRTRKRIKAKTAGYEDGSRMARSRKNKEKRTPGDE